MALGMTDKERIADKGIAALRGKKAEQGVRYDRKKQIGRSLRSLYENKF
jgi:hypothetical protein